MAKKRTASAQDAAQPAAGRGDVALPEGYEIKTGNGNFPQMMPIKRNGWSKKRIDMFLSVLANSCNVQIAAASAGVDRAAAYRRRARDPAFAAGWDAALQVGFDRLEQALLRRALEVADGFAVADEPAQLPPMTIAQAMDFLSRHRREVRGDGAVGRGSGGRRPTAAETDAALAKRLDAYDRSRGKSA
ncbi:MAG: hypothetical protein OSA47_09385 [Novosphingopyxis baekryungensis]|nr:hypothetical protein [Novosphingopyxis baekryungensis]